MSATVEKGVSVTSKKKHKDTPPINATRSSMIVYVVDRVNGVKSFTSSNNQKKNISDAKRYMRYYGSDTAYIALTNSIDRVSGYEN